MLLAYMLSICASGVVVLFAVALILVCSTKGSSYTPNKASSITVVSSHFREDLRWLKNSPYPVVIYTKKEADPVPPGIGRVYTCRQNKGNEVSSYLSYIIDHYDTLPEYVAFIHGHEKAWHQRMGMPMLEVIKRAHIGKEGFISLNNCFINDRDSRNKTFRLVQRYWDDVFEPWLSVSKPEKVFHDCCAQFLVSRERIRRLPKRAYQAWLEWVYDVPSNLDTGRIFEYVWHIIFGEKPILRNRWTYKRRHFL